MKHDGAALTLTLTVGQDKRRSAAAGAYPPGHAASAAITINRRIIEASFWALRCNHMGAEMQPRKHEGRGGWIRCSDNALIARARPAASTTSSGARTACRSLI